MNDPILDRWLKEIVRKASDIDPDDEHDWFSLWIGFVIGAGRPELANYDDYMTMGFPLEREA